MDLKTFYKKTWCFLVAMDGFEAKEILLTDDLRINVIMVKAAPIRTTAASLKLRSSSIW